MNEDNEKAFRQFLYEGLGWQCIPAKDRGKPQPQRPPLPYITVLAMNTWHIGIPYLSDELDPGGEVISPDPEISVHAKTIYSVQFYGPEAMDKAEYTTLWVRSNDAYLNENRMYPPRVIQESGYPDRAGPRKERFYIHDCSRVHQVHSLVNGVWEEQARIDMELQHRPILSQNINTFESVEFTIEDSGLPTVEVV